MLRFVCALGLLLLLAPSTGCQTCGKVAGWLIGGVLDDDDSPNPNRYPIKDDHVNPNSQLPMPD